MDERLRDQRISIIIHAALGIAVGIISPMIGRALYAAVVGIAVGLVAGQVVQRIVDNKGISWWFANGLMIYLLLWLDAWVFMINYF